MGKKMENKVAIEKNVSPKNTQIIEDEYGELVKLSKKELKQMAKRQGLHPANKSSEIAKQILGASYQKNVKLEKVFIRQPETLTKDQAKGFKKEENATTIEYNALGIPKIAKQEKGHAKFFAKRTK
jgi:hypothetical protein